MKQNYVYIAGDIMSSGSQYEALQIENILREVGIPFYSPRLNKSINDKKAVTVEDNNKLAERIVDCSKSFLNKIYYNINIQKLGMFKVNITK
jgi:hypothetical protein